MSLIPRDADQQPSSSAIVLDALPYVEPLDPHYERQAISLIEAELANTTAMEEDEMAMHPSLQQRPGSIAASDDNDVGLKNAPLARSMYQSMVERLQSTNSNNNDDGQPVPAAPTVEWEHPIPFHENELLSSFENNNNDTQTTTTTLSNHLRTSI
eukprot:scaffold28041_cov21-Cyclotella_meneghiniana.AAC.2